MKQLIQCAVVAVLYLSCPSRGLSQQNNLFADAYVSCPSLPKGILEAVAFCNTRMNSLPNNAESCSGMPIPFGIMGLFDDFFQ